MLNCSVHFVCVLLSFIFFFSSENSPPLKNKFGLLCAEFDIRRLFSHSSAESRFLCAHLKTVFFMCPKRCLEGIFKLGEGPQSNPFLDLTCHI